MNLPFHSLSLSLILTTFGICKSNEWRRFIERCHDRHGASVDNVYCLLAAADKKRTRRDTDMKFDKRKIYVFIRILSFKSNKMKKMPFDGIEKRIKQKMAMNSHLNCCPMLKM